MSKVFINFYVLIIYFVDAFIIEIVVDFWRISLGVLLAFFYVLRVLSNEAIINTFFFTRGPTRSTVEIVRGEHTPNTAFDV